jgi:alkyl sulfatase BDS1-like metallo-beta-lactamase superfamily hydrolase
MTEFNFSDTTDFADADRGFGDVGVIQSLLAVLDTTSSDFPIVTP